MHMSPKALLLSFGFIAAARAAETRSSDTRPRGVGPEFVRYYRPTSANTFSCIYNPSITIPFSRVNDDYCDCPDGSDEPGTSACSYLSPLSPPQHAPGPDSSSVNTTLALPGFYCKNKGHIPSYLRFESVNDGRCDYSTCCDGSDEWARVGGTKCEDRCKEIGKEYRKHEETRQKSLQGALKRRKELVAEASRLRKEVEIKIADLEIKITGHKIKVTDAESNLATVEHREKMKVVRGDSAKTGGGKLGIFFGLAQSRVNELRSTLEKTRTQRNDMVARVKELEDLLTALKDDHNPNFNDEGVKRAVRGWEGYAARDTNDVWSEAEERDLEAVLAEDSDSNGINWAEFDPANNQPDDVAAELYTITAYLPASLQGWISGKLANFRQVLIDNGILPGKSSSGDVSESKAVQDAKKSLEGAQRDLSGAESDLTRSKDDLSKDYGPDDVFRALKNTCVSKDSGEYTYELCFLGSTKQKPKKGGGDTNMGNFVAFDTELVDDDVRPDGKGLGSGERIVLRYENGQHCWNGPHRSTRIVLACAETDEIWKVTESEKCVYRMEVGTAAVCQPATRDGNRPSSRNGGRKDEL